MTRIIALLMFSGLPALSMTTCVDIDHTTVVHSDGSGKFVLSVTILDAKTKSNPDEGLAGLLGMCEGFSAISQPTIKKHGELETTTWTIYFQDINKFRVNDPEENRENLLSHTLTRKGAEATLVLRNGMITRMKKRAAEPLKQGEEDKASDDYYRFVLTLPGKIGKVEGWPAPKDRSVEMRLEDSLRFNARKGDAEARKRVDHLSDELKVTWTDADTAAKELETFKTEHAKAVEEWKKVEPRVRKLLESKKR